MKKGDHPEIDGYAKQLKDPRIYDFKTVDEARAYFRMRTLQRSRKLPSSAEPSAAADALTSKRSREEIVTEAYIQTYCWRKRLAPREPVTLPANTRALIFKLYVAGVLPVRLGGLNL